jgi:hypothetical protein
MALSCPQYPLRELFLDVIAQVRFAIPQGLTHYPLGFTI